MKGKEKKFSKLNKKKRLSNKKLIERFKMRKIMKTDFYKMRRLV